MSMASLIVQTHVMIADPDNINWVQVRSQYCCVS
jgi:hypothetical protein